MDFVLVKGIFWADFERILSGFLDSLWVITCL